MSLHNLITITIIYLTSHIFCMSSSLANNTQTLEEKVWFSHSESIKDIEQEVAKSLITNRNSVMAYYLMSLIQIKIFEENPRNMMALKKSIELAEHSFELDPNNSKGILAISYVKNYMGESQAAYSFVSDIMKLKKNHDWRIKLALYYALDTLDNKNQDKKINILKQLIKDKKSSKVIVHNTLTKELKLKYKNNPSNLIKELSTLNKSNSSPYFAHSIAKEHIRLNNFSQANRILNSINSNKYSEVDSQINQAILLYSKLNQPTKAIKIINKIKERAKNTKTNPNIMNMIDVHHALALIKTKQTNKGTEMLYKHMIEHSISENTFQFLRKNFDEMNHNTLFVQILQKLNNYHGKPRNYQMLAAILSLNLNKYKDSNLSLSKALILDPMNATIYESFGYNWFKMNDLVKSEMSYKKSVELDPQNAHTLYNLACMQSLAKKEDHSLVSLKKALSINPQLINAAQNDVDLINLRNFHGYQQLFETKEILAH